MWKFYVRLGCVLIMINNYGNALATSRRIDDHDIRPYRKGEPLLKIVEKVGYLAEEHFATTEDGYVLILHRIFAGPKSLPARNKSPVIFLHGLLASSDFWTMRGPATDLAYLLVDEGYDVWLPNFRGNTYSKKNINISPSRPEFWRFSWHENGIYDVPAVIDYVISQTGFKKVTVIGHSMGSTAIFVSLSIRPEYNEKIAIFISWAPPSFFNRRFRGPLTIVGEFGQRILDSLKRNGILEILSHDDFLPQLILDICRETSATKLCKDALLVFTGTGDPTQFDDFDFRSRFLETYPAGASVDTLDHYLQNIVNGSFREFDFGVNENYARYGSVYPPEYPLEKITAPVKIYYGANDQFISLSDIKDLERKLPNVVALKMIADPKFGHFDFVISQNVKKLLNHDVIDDIKRYNNLENRRLS